MIEWKEYLDKVYSYTPEKLAEIKQKDDAESKEIDRVSFVLFFYEFL